ncbi:MAG: EAL domain-containing protein [Sphaerochaeta sp.]|nr:EAL domain-containing protein [Sphaerochaeta sp.]
MVTKVLIVDDSVSDRMIIKSILKEYTTLTARDGVEALQMLAEHADINLMILDINMPNMNGFQVLDAVRTDKRHEKLCTIILTNYEEMENEIKGLQLGAVDYIRKPINRESLKARIEVHVELLRMQQLLEERLAENEMTFDTLFQQAPIGIAISQGNEANSISYGAFLSINPRFEEILGRTKEELEAIGWAQIIHPEDAEADRKSFTELQAGKGTSYSIEKRLIKPDGSIVWVYDVVARLSTKQQIGGYICLIQDITQRKEAEQALAESERSKSVLLSNIQGMAYRCNYDREWTMQFVSNGCYALTGYLPENLLHNKDLSYNDLITQEYREPLWKEWEHVLLERRPFQYEYEITTAKGVRKWVIEIGQGIYTEQGEVKALEGIIIDISLRKEMENKLRYGNEHDSWTGLYNYRHLQEVLTEDMQGDLPVRGSLISVNLSAMHSLSATYGVQYSLDLIRRIAKKLKQLCSVQCELFLVFEYRFVFYCKEYKTRNELFGFCERVLSTLEALLKIERIDAGIGVIEGGEWKTTNVNHLLKNLLITSEKAIQHDAQVNNILFYDKELEKDIKRREILRSELSKLSEGKDGNSIFLQFQPILDLKENQICGFEALARYNSKELGLVSPLEFIPIIEESKHIIPIGIGIIHKACSFIKRLEDAGYGGVKVSINISAIQLLHKDFVETLLEEVNTMKVNPEDIIIELTESIFSSRFDAINSILSQLKDKGITCAIDDFGTGYSSLSRERDLAITYLKIDKSFIDRLLHLREEETITSNIIAMAHRMGHMVIAEGVEQEKQVHYLRNHGCDMLQGYLISRPVDEDTAITLLTTYAK